MKLTLYNTKNLTIADGSSGSDNISAESDFRLSSISFSKMENNSSKDIYFAMKIGSQDFSKSEWTHLQCLKSDYGNIYELKQKIDIPATTTITVKLKNGTGTSLDIMTSLHGEEI